MKKIGLLFLIVVLVSFLGAQDDLLVIKNARILTVTKGVIEKGHILIQKGKIFDVGSDIKIPADAEVLDAEGKLITPGLIDSHSHLGLGPSGGVTEDNEGSNPVTPQLRIIDSIHPEGIPPHKLLPTCPFRRCNHYYRATGQW